MPTIHPDQRRETDIILTDIITKLTLPGNSLVTNWMYSHRISAR